MRKDEWFSQLEKELYKLSAAERQRAIEYYRELYSDKYEAGMSEEEICESFGKPERAAKEICENFGGGQENKNTYEEKDENSFTPTQTPKDNAKNTGSKLLATLVAILLAGVLGYWAAVATVTMFALEISFLSVGVALCAAGASTLGVGLIFAGGAVCLLLPCCAAVKGMFTGIVKLVKKCYNEIIGR